MLRKNMIITVAAILLVGGPLYYRETLTSYFVRDEIAIPEETIVIARELTATVRYDVPDGDHIIEFAIGVDENDVIQAVEGVDLEDPDHQVKIDEFSQVLIARIKGKKLGDLEPVDKVGRSSLTTAAFNEALAELKAQL